MTIAFSVLLSSVNSLTLSPALCTIFLKPTKPEDRNILFRWFNDAFDKVINFYGGCCTGSSSSASSSSAATSPSRSSLHSC